MLLFALRLHGGIEPAAQFGEGGMLVRAEPARVERLPVAVECDKVVRRRQCLAGERGGHVDQGVRASAGLALRHGRHPAQLGGTVDPAVVAAQLALGPLQRVFGTQRGHGFAADVERCRGLGEPQQRVVIALCRCQPGGPFGAPGFGLRQLSLDRLGCLKDGAGGRGRQTATFLEEPAQHRTGDQGINGGWANSGRRMREPQCRGRRRGPTPLAPTRRPRARQRRALVRSNQRLNRRFNSGSAQRASSRPSASPDSAKRPSTRTGVARASAADAIAAASPGADSSR